VLLASLLNLAEAELRLLHCTQHNEQEAEKERAKLCLAQMFQIRLDAMTLWVFFSQMILCNDESVFLDLLCSPETNALQYLLRIVKFFREGSASLLVAACERANQLIAASTSNSLPIPSSTSTATTTTTTTTHIERIKVIIWTSNESSTSDSLAVTPAAETWSVPIQVWQQNENDENSGVEEAAAVATETSAFSFFERLNLLLSTSTSSLPFHASALCTKLSHICATSPIAAAPSHGKP